MSEGKRRFKAHIAGEDYIIIGDSSTQHMETVVKLVEQQFKEIKQLMPGLSKERAAVLLAINAVSDQIYKQEELDRLKSETAADDKKSR
ncbi:cell division protein ZapA [Liquorilactobacillus satsumensis]|uniref:Cell division protein ZapA n=1 Tax=Liquorilactobacillus satsumensis DSM 16230 = JCM 12392 TaxID=1423801 RepID=A0A0R1UWG4_9LACO|nr:cell division protein ZapA [Liquorilactobacillus satsumensis]KRL97495.1 hypothetical protein FD50_GL001480 [Liquorilactobacillus satsumensis DSM 16230 = JCM 12392]MCC7666739.1 cell division protein ZapA [Liquorilactobacillus satsumensis]MCP9312642.1 cell division protein ZapA [Liquorilactobacillus satsumensis]MCP9327579.1 cell division protein ZapA [Liquorilactobacillus satsumensis]MCP9357615.1 cell division protein ZapA [Liquorilactobacillus satsumensis]